MKEFRYLEVKERPDGVEAKYKIGDLVQVISYSDWELYSWVSCGKVGLITEVRFFIQESFDPSEYIKYVTEYKVDWIDSSGHEYLDESMIILMEIKSD